MDMNSYVIEFLVRDRLDEMRARGERSARIRAARAESRSLPLALGSALIRLRQRLHGAVESSRMTLDAEPRESTHGTVRG
jgi:hypothetical protein